LLEADGTIMAMRPVYGDATMLHTRAMYVVAARAPEWDEDAALTQKVVTDLAYWVDKLNKSGRRGLAVQKQGHDQVISSDASATGAGAVLKNPRAARHGVDH
jgi:hypothetical protein